MVPSPKGAMSHHFVCLSRCFINMNKGDLARMTNKQQEEVTPRPFLAHTNTRSKIEARKRWHFAYRSAAAGESIQKTLSARTHDYLPSRGPKASFKGPTWLSLSQERYNFPSHLGQEEGRTGEGMGKRDAERERQTASSLPATIRAGELGSEVQQVNQSKRKRLTKIMTEELSRTLNPGRKCSGPKPVITSTWRGGRRICVFAKLLVANQYPP